LGSPRGGSIARKHLDVTMLRCDQGSKQVSSAVPGDVIAGELNGLWPKLMASIPLKRLGDMSDRHHMAMFSVTPSLSFLLYLIGVRVLLGSLVLWLGGGNASEARYDVWLRPELILRTGGHARSKSQLLMHMQYSA
jgi:hypothetical protein